MADNKVTIKFNAVGGGELRNTINAVYLANQRLIKGQKAFNRAQARVQAEMKRTSGGLFAMGHSARNTSGAFSVLRSQMLLVSFATTLAIRPILSFVKASSDKNEVINKSNVVFGDNINIVRQWARAMGDSVGRAESTMMQMASSLQDLFVPLGYTREASALLSTQMTELAIDVASFSNKIDTDVLQDFQSAIIGNHKTVRKYGVVITEAKLQQEAYNLGLIDTVKQLSENQKVQARMSLIQKGSTDAMGDAERTAKDYAQAVVRMKETWKELSEELGKAMKPFLAIGVRLASDKGLIKTYTVLLGGVALAYAAIRIQAWYASLAVKQFKKAMIRTGVGALIVGLGYLVDKFLLVDDAAQRQKKSVEDIKKAMKDAADATEFYIGKNELLEKQITNNIANFDRQEMAIVTQIWGLTNLTDAYDGVVSAISVNNDVVLEEMKVAKERADMNGGLEQEERSAFINKQLRAQQLKMLLKEDIKFRKKYAKVFGESLDVRRDELKLTYLEKERISALKSEYDKELAAKDALFAKNQEDYDLTKKVLEQEDKLIESGDERSKIVLNSNTIAKETIRLNANMVMLDKAKQKGNKEDIKYYTEAAGGIAGIIIKAQARLDMAEREREERQAFIKDQDALEREILDVEDSWARAIRKGREVSESYREQQEELEKYITMLEKAGTAINALSQFSGSFSSATSTMGANFGNVTSSMIQTWEGFSEAEREAGAESGANRELAITGAAEVAGMVVDYQMQQHEATMQRIRSERDAELSALKDSTKYRFASTKRKEKLEEEVNKKHRQRLGKEFKSKQDMQRAGVVIDTAAAMVKSFFLSPATFGMPMIAVAGALGAAQLALINQQQPPKAELGGLIGGKRHSQGGTLIEAERGEFIMSRSAVDSVGIETMNRINAGSGAGNVNVSFAGNVMSDDFVENEAIPKIKEAIRRGADIGVS